MSPCSKAVADDMVCDGQKLCLTQKAVLARDQADLVRILHVCQRPMGFVEKSHASASGFDLCCYRGAELSLVSLQQHIVPAKLSKVW